MCKFLRGWMVLAFLTTSSSACSGNLVLPGDEVPGDDSPAALSLVSGDNQRGTVGSELDEPLVVRVTDARSQPVEGVPVRFQFDGLVPDAEVTPQAFTNSDGEAAAEVRLGTEAGPITVLAQVPESSELRTAFGLTAVSKGRGGKGRDRDGDEDDDDEDD